MGRDEVDDKDQKEEGLDDNPKRVFLVLAEDSGIR